MGIHRIPANPEVSGLNQRLTELPLPRLQELSRRVGLELSPMSLESRTVLIAQLERFFLQPNLLERYLAQNKPPSEPLQRLLTALTLREWGFGSAADADWPTEADIEPWTELGIVHPTGQRAPWDIPLELRFSLAPFLPADSLYRLRESLTPDRIAMLAHHWRSGAGNGRRKPKNGNAAAITEDAPGLYRAAAAGWKPVLRRLDDSAAKVLGLLAEQNQPYPLEKIESLLGQPAPSWLRRSWQLEHPLLDNSRAEPPPLDDHPLLHLLALCWVRLIHNTVAGWKVHLALPRELQPLIVEHAVAPRRSARREALTGESTGEPEAMPRPERAHALSVDVKRILIGCVTLELGLTRQGRLNRTARRTLEQVTDLEPQLLDRLLALARALRLIHDNAGRLDLTGEGRMVLQLPPARIQERLWRFARDPESERNRYDDEVTLPAADGFSVGLSTLAKTLQLLERLEVGEEWMPTAKLVDWLSGHPEFLDEVLHDVPKSKPLGLEPRLMALLDLLEFCGMLQIAGERGRPDAVRLAPAWISPAAAEPQPAAPMQIIVQPNYEILVPLDLPFTDLERLARIATVTRIDRLMRFQLSRRSLLDGLAAGLDAATIHGLLTHLAGDRPLPQTVEVLIEESARREGEALIVPHGPLLIGRDEVTTRALATDRNVAPYIIQHIAPTVVQLAPNMRVVPLRKALAEKGFAVRVHEAPARRLRYSRNHKDEQIYLGLRTEQWRDLLGALQAVRDVATGWHPEWDFLHRLRAVTQSLEGELGGLKPDSPDDALERLDEELDDAVSRMLHSRLDRRRSRIERHAAFEGAAVTEQTDEIRDLLAYALEHGLRVRIDYTRHRGGPATRRVVRPADLGDGMLDAWCELRRDNRVFRLDRIARAELLDA